MKLFAIKIALGLFLFFLLVSCGETRAQAQKPFFLNGTVHITENSNGFVLYKDGKPYFIKGAGYLLGMDKLAACGGNSIRTWGSDNAEYTLDEAQSNGLTVTLGLWVGHERHGFDYNDRDAVEKQLIQFSNVVEQYKNHPALLIWGIGNEVNIQSKNPKVWDAINEIAAMIHRIDTNHPTMTVTAGINKELLDNIITRAPQIDILGVNSYGGLGSSLYFMSQSEWNRPFIVTEWGPNGYWEVRKTEWGASIEPLSGEKRDMYQGRYEMILQYTNRCLGSYAFLWGFKQERTHTWFGLLLDSGEYTEAANAMMLNWTGSWPKHIAPHLTGLILSGKEATESIVLEAGKTYDAEATLTNYGGQNLTYTWQVLKESSARSTGGDQEFKPGEVKDSIKSKLGNKAVIIAPKKPGKYRLFVKIQDPFNNAATGNIPFMVNE